MANEGPIVCVLVVTFHHERGNEIEFIYPPGNEITTNNDFLKDVVFLAMPDQAHHQDRDYIYFCLEKYHCVACYSQMATKDVKDKTEDMTRASVQKSVCIVSRYAYYGTIRDVVEPATLEYFQGALLQDRAIMLRCYNDLVARFRQLPTLAEFSAFAESERLLFEESSQPDESSASNPPILKKTTHGAPAIFERRAVASSSSESSLSSSSSSDMSDVPLPISGVENFAPNFHVIPSDTTVTQPPITFADVLSGVRIKWLLQKFERSVIVLFKALFLERRICFYSTQVSDVCDTIVALTALMPLLLEKLSCASEQPIAPEQAYKKILNRQRRHSSAPVPKPAEPAILSSSPGSDIDEGFVRIEDTRSDEQRHKDEEKRKAREQQDREIIEIQQQYVAQALPLNLLHHCFYSPYICLQQVETLTRSPSFLIGTSNALFQHNTDLLPMDIFVNITNGELQFRSAELEQALQLTMEDRVFMDYIIETMQEHSNVTEPHAVGSAAWIRSMFYDYTLSLCCAIVDAEFQPTRLPEWNSTWCRRWETTHNFRTLKIFVEASMLPPGGGTPKKLHPALRLQTDSLMQKGLVALAAVNKTLSDIKHTEFVKTVNSGLSSLTERVNKLMLQTPLVNASASTNERGALTGSRRNIDDNDLIDSNTVIDINWDDGFLETVDEEDNDFDDDDLDDELRPPSSSSSSTAKNLPKNKVIIDPEAYARARQKQQEESPVGTPTKSVPVPAKASAAPKKEDEGGSLSTKIGSWFSSVKASVEQTLKEFDEPPRQPIPSRAPPKRGQ